MSDQVSDTAVDVPKLVERWRQGDQDAATLLFDRYQKRLLLLVSGHLNDKLRRRLDAEELVGSIMRSAFRVTSERDIGCEDETGFWKWLVTVALNKTFKRIDRETAAKRNPKREAGGDTVLGERILREPTPDDAAEVSELLEKILDRLTDDQRQMLLGKLDGLSHAEIAAKLKVSTKTVQRNSQDIREVAVSILGSNVPEWLSDETSVMAKRLVACLDEPLLNWLPSNGEGREFVRPSTRLSEIFDLDSPDVKLLNGVRSVAKQRGSENGGTPQMICATIYLLAIATARIKLGLQISSDGDQHLKTRVGAVLKNAWIDRSTNEKLKRFVETMGS